MEKINRETKETKIRLALKINGKGKNKIKTGIKFLDHMLSTLAVHGKFNLDITADSKDGNEHHLVEDIGICLGKAINQSIYNKKIKRFGWAIVPMDDSIAAVAIDFGNRFYLNFNLDLKKDKISDLSKESIEHFLKALAENARMNLYAKIDGKDDHHKVESLFKALALSLKQACQTK